MGHYRLVRVLGRKFTGGGLGVWLLDFDSSALTGLSYKLVYVSLY